MNDVPNAQEDLAFLRRLVESDRGGRFRRKFGYLYMTWGAAWGVYTLMQGLGMLGLLNDTARGVALVAVLIVSVAATIWGAIPPKDGAGQTTSTRALGGVFAGIGMSYLTVLAVLMWLTSQRHDGTFAMIYAVVVFAGQGAGWYVTWVLQRRAWLAIVAIGWYATALALGFSIGHMAVFVFIAGVSLLVLMGIPGWIMSRASIQ